MISLSNVCKTFETKQGSFHAVRDVSLNIKKNSIHGIIGPSGAGKSTLIRLINQLEVHDSGYIEIFNYEDLKKLNKESTRMFRKEVSMIFQRFNVLGRKTVLQNIVLPLSFHKRITQHDMQKAKELIHLVGLKGYENSYPSQLSGGQLQRVGIARALITEPKILLCDEPTSALDTQTIKSVLNLIKNIKEKLNLTVVLVTHDMNVVKEICDYVTVMDQGKIIETAPIEDIIFNPKNKVTKELLGTVGFNIPELIKENQNKNLYVLRFSKESTSDSVVSSISRALSIVINIHYANITPNKEGMMLIEVISKNNILEEELKNIFREKGVELRHV